MELDDETSDDQDTERLDGEVLMFFNKRIQHLYIRRRFIESFEGSFHSYRGFIFIPNNENQKVCYGCNKQ